MKILHVITSLYTGGAEKLMVDLLPRMASEGHQVELAVFDGRVTPFYNLLRNRGIVIHSLGHGSVYSPKRMFKLRSLIRRGRYDIVHTHNTACQLYASLACIATHNRLVTTEHSSTNRRRNYWYWRAIDRMMYRRYSNIVCISQAALNNLAAYLPALSPLLLMIPNGIDTNSFISPIKDISSLSRYVITMVAAFRHGKDQDCLIRAMALLPDNYSCRLVGDGVRRAECEALAATMGVSDRIEFMGVRTDIPKILADSDINVLASHWEGLSLSSLECMASGRPFIASDVDGLHDIVAGAGILFPDGDAHALANAILSITAEPTRYASVALASQQRAASYDIAKTVQGYLSVYQQ